MNILHVVATLAAESGGPAKACLDMAHASAGRGHAVSIFTTERGLDADARARPDSGAGVAIRYFPEQWPRTLATSWPMARALMAEAGGFDVVHLHSLYLFTDWATARACRAHGVPYILRPHGTLDPYQYRQHRLRKLAVELLFQNDVTRHAAALHYTAEDEMRLAEPYALGVPGVVIPLGLELEAYSSLPPKGEFRKHHPEIGQRPIVLFLGRLHPKKGLDVLARAFARCVRQGSDAFLVVAGPDDGMLTATQRIVAEEGIVERTLFTGMVSGREKLALLADAELFALPSYSENFGIAAVEALACGVPVLISPHVNLWREVEAAGCGRIAPVEPEAVAEALAALLADPATRRAMGQKGRTLVANRFTWPRVADALDRLYKRIAAAARKS
ncbi:MAG TPA: glycosyltransferase [Alphaproteobacteria bacterium]|nr:glycosyltransferase [Alphaproteobacteria bacterium]